VREDAAACALVRAASGFYERTAARAGMPWPRAGAVAFVQRFDSGLRLDVPLHVLWLDGAYGWEPGRGQPVFHAQRDVTDACAQQLAQRNADRVLRALRKAGKWWTRRRRAAAGGDGGGDGLLPGLAAAAVEGRAALGGPGRSVARVRPDYARAVRVPHTSVQARPERPHWTPERRCPQQWYERCSRC
jgi:hypothetical protein